MTGVEITGVPEYKKSSFVLDLLARGVLIFLIIAGTVGCYTSCFKIAYNELLVLGITILVSF